MDALYAVLMIDIVDDFHQIIALLALWRRVEEVELDGSFWIYVADDDSSTLIHGSCYHIDCTSSGRCYQWY